MQEKTTKDDKLTLCKIKLQLLATAPFNQYCTCMPVSAIGCLSVPLSTKMFRVA